MEKEDLNAELVAFFKALADENRLKIIGLLATQPYTVEQMAEILHLGASTISHHLARLAEIGLVSARAEGYYSVYKLETAVLETMAKKFLSRDSLPALATDVDMDAYDRKIVKDFTTADGRIKAFPSQQKKFLAILRFVLKEFEPGKRYTEKQVNEILSRYNEDTAMLRRSLVDFKYMARASGEYWRIDEGPLQ